MVKTNNEIYLEHSSIFRSIVNIFVIPFILFIVIFYIDNQWSLFGSLMYLVLVSFLQWYRAKKLPTYENIFRKNVFFEILGWSLVVVTGSVIILILIVI